MKTVLVVGAAGGIGLEVTRGLVAAGSKVVATVMDAAQADMVKGDVPGVAQVEIVDLSDADGTAEKIGGLVAALDRLDQVVICAAIGTIGVAELTSLAAFRRTMEINTFSNIAIFQATIAALRATKGRLLCISSMSGRLAMPFLGAYTASKYALEGVLDIIRQEVAADGVKVIMIEPGGVRTPMVKDQIALAARMDAALTPDQAARYGMIHKGFIAAAQAGYDGLAGGSTPGQVAAVILGALAADDPETRYVVGDDASQLIGARTAMSDREFDGMLGAFFSGGA